MHKQQAKRAVSEHAVSQYMVSYAHIYWPTTCESETCATVTIQKLRAKKRQIALTKHHTLSKQGGQLTVGRHLFCIEQRAVGQF